MIPRGAKAWTLIMLSAAFWSAGCSCAGSLASLQSDEPPAVTPDLSGKWAGIDTDGTSADTVLVENADGNNYRLSELSSSSEKIKGDYLLSLVQVESHTILDARFEKVADKTNSFNGNDLAVEPIHFIGRIDMDVDTVRLRFLDYAWLREMASKGKLKLPYFEKHLGGDDYFILTSESDELGEFVREYAEDLQAFSTTVTFQRVPPDGSGSNDAKP
jgi:hypothetical protein